VTDNRETLRAGFASVAQLYHEARPDYPEQLYDSLVELTGLHPGDNLVEVGCGTGKATLPLLWRGFRVTCTELSPELAAEAGRNLVGFPATQVFESAFETWHPPGGQRFGLVFAATAWHWVDPAVRYQRAWELLRPAAHLAFWSAAHVLPDTIDPFLVEIQDVYDQIGEGRLKGANWPPGELVDNKQEIEESGLFEDVVVRPFEWDVSYDADGYIALLSTFSSHIAMKAWKRERLFNEVRTRLAERQDGRLRRHWGAVLHVARRSDERPDGWTSNGHRRRYSQPSETEGLERGGRQVLIDGHAYLGSSSSDLR
jgi:SAM-dependent methyltransferase